MTSHTDEPDERDLVPLNPDDWAIPFLAAYTGDHAMNLSASAQAAGVHPRAIKKRIELDPTFADLYQQAEDALTHAAEHVAYNRAIHGTQRPIFQHGEIVGHVTDIDNRLLQWWLERRKPDTYHIATRIEHVNPDTPGAFTFRLGDKPLELAASDEDDAEQAAS